MKRWRGYWLNVLVGLGSVWGLISACWTGDLSEALAWGLCLCATALQGVTDYCYTEMADICELALGGWGDSLDTERALLHELSRTLGDPRP